MRFKGLIVRAAPMLALAAPAQARWIEARTNNFIVVADAAEDQVRTLATRLERFDQALRKLRGLPVVDEARPNPLTIYALGDVAAVQRLCRGMEKRRGCANVMGFYSGSAAGSYAFTPLRAGGGSTFDLSAMEVLLHEYTHHFMLENWAAAYPAWFREGFAEFNGSTVFEKDGGVGLGRPATHRYYSLLTGRAVPLASLLAGDKPLRTAEEVEAMYAWGWLLTHYLTFSEARKGQLTVYLEEINAGVPAGKAATQAFGDLAVLDRELTAYLRRRKLTYYHLGAAAFRPVEVRVRLCSPGEAATMPIRLRSKRGVSREEAQRLAPEARAAAAAFPGDAAAQTALAEAEYDAGDVDRAEAAADRALAADPRARVALIYKGLARARRLETTRSTDAAAWSEARRWFIKANAIDHNDAAALMLFYDSFGQERRAPTANAVAALEQAFRFVPQDDALRWRVARHYAANDRLAEARATLLPLAYDPHATADNPYARLLAAIDAKDMPAVRAQIARFAEVEQDEASPASTD